MTKRIMFQLGITVFFCLLCLAAKSERDWKVGKVLDSSRSQESYVTGSVTNAQGSGTATGTNTTVQARGSSTGITTVHRVTINSNQLLVQGADYFYVIEDSQQKGGGLKGAIANRHHGCRFIVGEDVKYAQEKGDLWIIDADGKECKVPIVRQEKRQDNPTN